MKKMHINEKKLNLRKKLLALSVSAVATGIFTSGVVQASDIDIYQTAKSGDITLMFMLDISGSMDDKDGGSTTRIARVKTAMKDLLEGNASKGITRISDDKIIGLSTLGVKTSNSYANTGAVLIPARRLDASVGTITQRQVLLNAIANFTAYTNTPTARSFAETVSYLMGTTTASRQRTVSDMPYFRYYEYKWGGSWYSRVQKCSSWNSSYSSCSNWTNTDDSIPTGDTITSDTCTISYDYRNQKCYVYSGIIDVLNNNSGFSYSNNNTKNSNQTLYEMPLSLSQTEEIKKCSGQGVYVLTDGEPTEDSNSLPLMQGALGAKGQSFSCDDSSSYSCLNALTQAILDPLKNPAALKFKTAVVGFGKSFNNVASYDKNKTQAQNIAALGTINTNVKRAAEWGIKGEGGWYSGNSSEDVVNSVNEFINSLGSDIPAVTTGTPTIPNDELNPSVVQSYAYYPQFQPTPDKSYQLWSGNLKKYNVTITGELTDKNNNGIVNDKGRLLDNIDLWAPALVESVKDADENVLGSLKNRAVGGVKSQLRLRAEGTTTTVNRKLLTNRQVASGGTATNGTVLKQIALNYITDTGTKDDTARGHLMSLLGYAVDTNNLSTVTVANLTASTRPNELRQVGAVMHSSPVLLTSQGEITYNDSTGVLDSTDRNDYVLFGTTQGVLHVVDASTGVEKFGFVPNEMIENQKEAFLKQDATSGGLNKLFYGIDGAWTVYSEYVLNSAGKLTVGTGSNSQEGKQLVYGGLRMGGRGYYALDLQNINDPKLKFNINPDAATTGPLSYMGQSWSKPTIGWVRWGKEKKLVMFVGGGYDAGGTDGNAKTGGVKGAYAGYEADDYQQGDNGRGAGVYMFDALNGDLLWWASSKATSSSATASSGTIGLNEPNLKYSVVSEITTADRDSDGLIDHLYFGDLGGQVFRIDLDNKAAAKGSFAKTPRRILDLSQTDGKAPRFYEAPAFSIYDVEGKTFAVVSIGSGNRSLPLKDYTVGTSGRNYDSIYNIYDKDVTDPDLYTMVESKFQTQNINLLNATTGLKEITDTNRFGVPNYKNLIAPYSTNGWYYKYQSQKVQSEKVFSTPIVINNDMYVSTFDGSKDGLSGDCGAGVKGESFLTKFCMPYGQCAQTGVAANYRLNLGAGITGGAIGAGDGGTTRLIVANTNTSNITGGSAIIGARYNTKMNLVTQRWYEKYR